MAGTIILTARHIGEGIGRSGINTTSIGTALLLVVVGNVPCLWALTSVYWPLGVLVLIFVVTYLSLALLLTLVLVALYWSFVLVPCVSICAITIRWAQGNCAYKRRGVSLLCRAVPSVSPDVFNGVRY